MAHPNSSISMFSMRSLASRILVRRPTKSLATSVIGVRYLNASLGNNSLLSTARCLYHSTPCLQKMQFLYSAAVSSPLDRSKRFTLFALPDGPVHSDTNSASPGSILARQQLRAKTKSLTFPPLSIARYTFIQLSQQGRQWREGKCIIFETVAKRDSNPGSLDCESGVLPQSYRALQAQCHSIHKFLL